MEKKEQLIDSIAKKEKQIQSIKKSLDHLIKSKRYDVAKLRQIEDEEIKQKYLAAQEECFEDLNINVSDLSSLYVLFDVYGNYQKTIDVSNHKDQEEVEKYLQSEKLYGQKAVTFDNQNIEWYQMSFKEQLVTFGWSFDNLTGKLKNLAW